MFPSNTSEPFLGDALSKARVCGSSVAGIAGSNPVEVMDVSSECCVFVVCCQAQVSASC
jgi:hypothetical protein